MGIFRLILAHPQHPETPRLVAEHLDPAWLKQRGYEIARNLGDQAAIWAAEPRGPQPVLALRCRTGHALAIVTA
ncbi:MAG TPA: hypothetical protein PKZ19_05210 [Zoogloea sp.]|jgi:hypothetical protein|uniref:hypothetical protein n=1 Tax=Zoogloea sp. TaxID=49181 RepID=UPI002CB2B8D3|nr:hypothetical protein [Zoogloea sp.]